jgi:hypothetical protein
VTGLDDSRTTGPNGVQYPGLESRVRLTVQGFSGHPREVTSLLGVSPSRTWLEGEVVHPKTTLHHKVNGWSLQSPVDSQGVDPERAVRALLDLFPDPSCFARLPANAVASVSCTIYGSQCRPFLCLSPETVARLAAFGLGLDMDPYELPDDESGND